MRRNRKPDWELYLHGQNEDTPVPAWEAFIRGSAGAHAPAVDHYGSDEENEEINYDRITAEEAGVQFMSMMVDLKMQGALPETTTCILAF